MSKTGRYVQEIQERLYRKGIDVDDTNDLQGETRDEWEDWLNQQLDEASDDRRQSTDTR